MKQTYIDKELDICASQEEPVRVIQIGSHVGIELESQTGKRHYSRWLNQEQFELLLAKMLKVSKIRKSREYPGNKYIEKVIQELLYE